MEVTFSTKLIMEVIKAFKLYNTFRVVWVFIIRVEVMAPEESFTQ